MEKSKKQKLERQLRQSLKTIVQLQPNLVSSNQEERESSLLYKSFPQLAQLNSLRILTVLEVIYLLEVYLELLNRYNPLMIEDMRIGIIGGGITGRLILNSILPFSKDGLDLKNITVSTRQTQNFKVYVQNFGIKCHFDNELTAKDSDFLIIATPATLDNWIITDLKQSLATRIESSIQKKTKSLASTTLQRQFSDKKKTNFGKLDDKIKKTQQKSVIKEEEPVRKFPFKPLVFILTSDISQQKCKKMFNFPVLTPSIRFRDLPSINQILQMFTIEPVDHIEVHQKILAWWFKKEKAPVEQIDETQKKEEQKEGEKAPLNEASINRFLNIRFSNIIEALGFVVNPLLQSQSVSSSVSNTVSVAQFAKENKQKQDAYSQVLEVITSQGQLDETLFKKIRKWTMAYNNFVS